MIVPRRGRLGCSARSLRPETCARRFSVFLGTHDEAKKTLNHSHTDSQSHSRMKRRDETASAKAREERSGRKKWIEERGGDTGVVHSVVKRGTERMISYGKT